MPRASFGGRAFRRKRQRVNFFLNDLREASPLAAFRRKRTSFGKLHLWRLSEGSRRKPKEANLFWKKRVLRLSELVLKKARPPEGRASFGKLHLWRLSEGSARGSRRKQLVLKKARPSESFGKLHLWRLSEGSELVSVLRLPPEGRASFGVLPKEGRPSLPSGSFTSGGVAAFRRKRTSFVKLHLWRRPSASFGKLHLWRDSGFPKEAPEVPEGSNFFLNVLREASPLAAFRRKRTCFRPSASSRRKGVLRFLPKEGRPSLPPVGRASFASFGFLRKASPLAASFGKLHLWRGTCNLRKDARCLEVSADVRPLESDRKKTGWITLLVAISLKDNAGCSNSTISVKRSLLTLA